MSKAAKILSLLIIGYMIGSVHWYGWASMQAYYIGFDTGYSTGMMDAALAAEQGNLIHVER